jgi:RNA polymerase sigma-70 factor (ECF subfamily)
MDNERLHVDYAALALISKGNISAFTSIFRKYYKPLVLFAHAIVRDRDVAEDLVQALFCKLWEERASLARVTYFQGYLYRSVKNCCQNYCRHRQLVATLPIPSEVQDEEILSTIIEEEVYLELIRQIDRLPSRCREIILLKLRGMDTPAIASTCRVTEETVRSQYRRGKNLLRKALLSRFKDSTLLPLLLTIIDGLA